VDVFLEIYTLDIYKVHLAWFYCSKRELMGLGKINTEIALHSTDDFLRIE
jgi:hypothetical protein